MNSDVVEAPSLQPLAIEVVSVQSQVVYGSVGNNIAVPAFERQGLRVAAVPTVILSNTPHYASMHGGPVPTAWFAGYLDDLRARGALRELRAIQVGYLGSAEQAEVLARWIDTLLAEQPDVRVHIDPVIGDHDHGVYIDPAIVPIYRQRLLPLAHGLFPNGFELAELTGRCVSTMDEVIDAARSLLVGRTRWVVVTSAAPESWTIGRMRVAIVTADAAHTLEHVRIDAAPKGTGDLFSAVLTGQLLAGRDLRDAAQQAADAVVAAVTITHARNSAELLLPGEQGAGRS